MKPNLFRVAAVLLLLAGCGRDAPPSAATGATPPAPASTASATPAGASATVAPEVVKEFPTLVLRTFDGADWSLAERRGKWVVVNFWATWCAPCLKEIPELDAFDRARADVEVIGLAYEEIERPDMEAFLKEHRFSYPVALVDVYTGLPDFPIPRGLPMTYVIAPDGKVAKEFLGPVDMDVLNQIVGAPATP
jgi:thiol-disulfide isomerase/thioredoxin